MKKCKFCGKKCWIPAWIYCSDDCSRLSLNKRALKRCHEKKKKENKQAK